MKQYMKHIIKENTQVVKLKQLPLGGDWYPSWRTTIPLGKDQYPMAGTAMNMKTSKTRKYDVRLYKKIKKVIAVGPFPFQDSSLISDTYGSHGSFFSSIKRIQTHSLDFYT